MFFYGFLRTRQRHPFEHSLYQLPLERGSSAVDLLVAVDIFLAPFEPRRHIRILIEDPFINALSRKKKRVKTLCYGLLIEDTTYMVSGNSGDNC